MRVYFAGMLAVLGVSPIAGYACFVAARWTRWYIRGGTRLGIPWTTSGFPVYSAFAHRRRTRSPLVADSEACSLVLWRILSRPALVDRLCDWITGGAGAVGATVAVGNGWHLISARLLDLEIDGPHYAPERALRFGAWVRFDLRKCLDVDRLLADMATVVADARIRHKRHALFSYLLGRTDERSVTCSGVIGNLILRQPGTPLGSALRQALRERFTYGEITPSDLARALSIVGVVAEHAPVSVRTIPFVPFRPNVTNPNPVDYLRT